MTSASVRLAGLMTSVPWTLVSARMRSRTAAARSNSSASAAASISVARSRWTLLARPERKARAWSTRPAYSVSLMRPTQGAEQRLIWCSRQGRERFLNTVSRQERSRNTRCMAVTVWLTDQAEAKGP